MSRPLTDMAAHHLSQPSYRDGERTLAIERGWRLPYRFLCALLLCAPLPLASNRVWACAWLAMGLMGLLCLVMVESWWRTRRLTLPNVGWGVGSLLVLYALCVWAQTLSLGGTPITVDSHYTRQALLMTLGYISAYFLVLYMVETAADVRQFVRFLFFLGVFQAIVAVFLYSAKAKYTLFYYPVDHGLRTYGTFSYHNSLANYLLMGIGAGVGLLLSSGFSGSGGAQHWRRWLLDALRFVLSDAMRLRLMLVVMVIALVLTRSRMGNVAFLVSLLLVGLPVLLATGRMRLKVLLLVLSIVLVDVWVVGNLIGLERVAARLQQTGLEAQQDIQEESVDIRSAPAQQAWAMVLEKPWLGRGAGTFYTSFPQYAGPQTRQHFDHAHNDYIEWLVETGVVGFGLLALAVLATMVRLIRVMRQPASADDVGIAAGLLMAIVAVLIQAMVDFHFQIPANALLFTVIIATCWRLKMANSINEWKSHGKV